MGHFSWIYSDTNKQLVDNKIADTYLLVPKPFQEKYGKAIYEGCYGGYGNFGRYDVYDLIPEWNKESDLMRDCDVGKVRIDDLYDLIMQAKYPAPCHISMIGFPILASEPDVHLPAYPALH